MTLLPSVPQDVCFCFQSHSCTLLHLAIAHIGSKLKFDNITNFFSLKWSLYITDRWSVIILYNTIMFGTGRKLNFILCHILFASNIKLFVTQLINNRVSHSMVPPSVLGTIIFHVTIQIGKWDSVPFNMTPSMAGLTVYPSTQRLSKQ